MCEYSKKERKWYCEAKYAIGDLLDFSLQRWCHYILVHINSVHAQLLKGMSCTAVFNEEIMVCIRGGDFEIKCEKRLSFAVLYQHGAIGHHNLFFLLYWFNQHSTIAAANFF